MIAEKCYPPFVFRGSGGGCRGSMWNIKAKWKHMDLLPALGIKKKNNIETTTTAKKPKKSQQHCVLFVTVFELTLLWQHTGFSLPPVIPRAVENEKERRNCSGSWLLLLLAFGHELLCPSVLWKEGECCSGSSIACLHVSSELHRLSSRLAVLWFKNFWANDSFIYRAQKTAQRGETVISLITYPLLHLSCPHHR